MLIEGDCLQAYNILLSFLFQFTIKLFLFRSMERLHTKAHSSATRANCAPKKTNDT